MGETMQTTREPYLLDSPEGQQVFEKMNLSEDQRFEQRQPRMPGFE